MELKWKWEERREKESLGMSNMREKRKKNELKGQMLRKRKKKKNVCISG